MNAPSRLHLLEWGPVAALGLLLLASCESARPGRNESAAPNKASSSSKADERAAEAAAPRPVAQFAGTAVTYQITQAALASAFIHQFNDGTVIDKVMVRKAPAAPGLKTPCFLVGMGLKNGNFRAMALPLAVGTDGHTYYLSPDAPRYVLTGVGCPGCYFDFDDSGQITGTSCSENSGGSSCDLRLERTNSLLLGR